MKKHIPNLLTCGNLICGSAGIVFLLEDRGLHIAFFVWLCCILDFFDGFAARLLKVSSPIGKELDSLADVVSFGLLPALVMYKMISASTLDPWLPFCGLLIVAFSALRLAIFNIDETQRDSFRGLNTPANTLFITGLPFLAGRMPVLNETWMLLTITVVFSLLMVSPLEFFAFKFKNFGWQDNKIRFTFIALTVLLLALMQTAAIPVIILLYIGMSLGVRLISK